MSEVLSVTVDGKRYIGWKSVRIHQTIEAVASSFEVEASDRVGDLPIYEEAQCVVMAGDDLLITGYIDSRNPSYGPDDHSLRFSGRDATGDLVDCSANLNEWEFTGIKSLSAFVQKVCDSFGIPVSVQASLLVPGQLPAPPDKFSVAIGDTAFDAIENACRKAGVLLMADGTGGLLITRAGVERATTALERGKNILRASGSFSMSGRFHRYVVHGQHYGNPKIKGTEMTSVKGSAIDKEVTREQRVLLMRAEGGVTRESARVRAEWEAAVRAARGDTVNVTVQGWRQGAGTLWPLNALVPVRDDFLRVNGDMLITGRTLTMDGDSGTTTELTLRRPDAFTPQPEIKSATGARGWKELKGGA